MGAAHACAYRRVAIAAWAALSAAGDAHATWQAICEQRRCLALDPEWGWVGRCAAGDQEELALAVCRRLPRPQAPLAFGMATSKGTLAQHAAAAGPPWLAAWPGAASARLAARLQLGLHLPVCCVAACSTALATLLAGADALERGQAAQALVGAAEASLTPLILAGFRSAGVLCGATLPQAFAAPTGFAPAEGAAAFLLAERGPWRLLAGVRLGDAEHETHCLDPLSLGCALEALWDLAPRPELIVCHATGTAHGDAYEGAALARGPWAAVPRLCAKPWIGHTLGASGGVELAAALQAPCQRLWKLSLGFGGHIVALAVERMLR